MSASMQGIGHTRLKHALVGGAAAFVMLAIVFVATMLTQTESVDWPYLSWAILRIAVISFVTSLFLLAVKRMRLLWSVLLGSAVGLILGAGYVAVQINA